MTNLLSHWVGGAPSRGTSDCTAPGYNPATGDITNDLPLASIADVDAAVTAAIAAFPAWLDASLTPRQPVLFEFRELLNARKGELAEIVTSEHGKVLPDAPGTEGLQFFHRDSAVTTRCDDRAQSVMNLGLPMCTT
jgi:malonate-semialdehyde dehydrogenase (acetylating) / methylmalonate-semialdehyde dehydrogenase